VKFTGEFVILAPRSAVFARLNDPQFFAACLEGVSDLEEVDPDHYTATLETKVAYIKFRFAVSVAVVEREAPGRVVAKVEGTPKGIVGRLTATATADLDDAENGAATRVTYDMDVALAGKLGSLGQPVLRSKAKEMERGFVAKASAAFAEETA
jgi:hypothetical protein